MVQSSFEEIVRKLKVNAEDQDLFRQALTHKSYLGEVDGAVCNERLEFLGDSILGMVAAEYVYARFPDKPEGELAKARAVAVSEPILADASRKLGIAPTLLMSTGEDTSGGRERSSMLADAFEAVVAALYLTQGLESARSFILKSLGPILDDIDRDEHHRNYKSAFQELSQDIFKQTPNYVVVESFGSDHDKTFTVDAVLDGKPLGRGTGKNKKQAEQAAAHEALIGPEFQSVYESRNKHD